MKTVSSNSKLKKIIIAIVTVAALVAIVLISYSVMNQTQQPERNIANFCSVVAKEKNNLMSIQVSNSQKATSYADVEKVSPDEIIQTVREIKQGYKQMADNPASSTSANAGLTNSFNAFNSYVNKSCPGI